MVIVFKAMGAEADQEIMQLAGNDEEICSLMVTTIQDCKQQRVFTQMQALEFLGGLFTQGQVLQWFLVACSLGCRCWHSWLLGGLFPRMQVL